MALTPKQEKFCRGIASGMSAKDAYIAAYDTKAKETTIYVEASKLMLNEEIQGKIKALMKPLEEKAQLESVNARQKQIDFILERIEICKVKDDEQSLIRWSDQLNKLLNLYREDSSLEEKKNDFADINTDILRKITEAV